MYPGGGRYRQINKNEQIKTTKAKTESIDEVSHSLFGCKNKVL